MTFKIIKHGQKDDTFKLSESADRQTDRQIYTDTHTQRQTEREGMGAGLGQGEIEAVRHNKNKGKGLT